MKELNDGDSLHEMQELVGGHIQAIYPFEERVGLIRNREAHLHSLPFNRAVGSKYGAVFGTFLICGLGEDKYCSLTPEQISHYKKVFRHAERLIGIAGNSPLIMLTKPKPRNPRPKNKGRSAPGHDR